MDLRPKISQKDSNQLGFQYLYHFRSLKAIIFKILTSFDEKMAKNEKMRFSQISLKSYQGSQFLLQLAEIQIRYSLHDSKQSYRGFF